jgi:O-antigen ligase
MIYSSKNNRGGFGKYLFNLNYLSWLLLVFWICFLGVQVQLQWLPLRFAPSDLILFVFLMVTLLTGKFNFESFITKDLLLLLLVFTVSGFIALIRLQFLSFYTVINKYFGLVILILSFFFIKNVIKGSKVLLQKSLEIFVLTGGFLNLFYIVLEYLLGSNSNIKSVLLYGGLRLRGLLVDPNAYGGFLVIVFFLCLPLLINEKTKIKKVFYFIVLLSSFFGLVLTASRSAYFAFVAGSFVVLLLGKKLKKYIAYVFIIFVLSFLFLYIFVPDTFSFLIARITSMITILARLEVINTGLNLFVQSPLVGVGLGYYYELSRLSFAFPGGIIIHNTYVWILVETGVIGFLVFFFFVFHVLQTNFRLIQKFKKSQQDLFYIAIGIFSAIIAMCIFAVGIEAFYQRYLWMLFAFLDSVIQISKKGV